MNDLDHDLETELRDLRPAQPSSKLASAIDRELQRGGVPRGWTNGTRVSLWASWVLTATAAAVAVVAWWPTPTRATTDAQSTTTAETNVVPVGTTNVLFDARDEGIVVLDDGRAARKVRLHYVDTLRLQERDASSSIAISRPREEVQFLPVNFY